MLLRRLLNEIAHRSWPDVQVARDPVGILDTPALASSFAVSALGPTVWRTAASTVYGTPCWMPYDSFAAANGPSAPLVTSSAG